MCGICGKYTNDQVDQSVLREMSKAVRHRGPDDDGLFVDGNVGLGVRRLSIIDVQGGRQPIHNEDENVWIVYNGEIYNYLELRDDLESRGHEFYTLTDTEVIVHLYEEYGSDCVRKLNGMFSFAIFDSETRSLILARDRIGIKPLHYTLGEGQLVFGSEIKSILQDPTVDKELDFDSLLYYLNYEYIPAPRTIYKQIRKLLPGHLAIYDGKEFKLKKFWDLTDFASEERGELFYSSRLRSLLEDSVRRRMISDVPLGAFLSGGLDSSTIVALMSRKLKEPVVTFSVGFEEESYDELKYARKVSDFLGTEHYEVIAKADSMQLVDLMMNYFDEPIANTSIIPIFLVSQLSSKHVKVALAGDGADELFAGYDRYIASRLNTYYEKLPRKLRGIVRDVSEKIPCENQRRGVINTFKRFVEGAGKTSKARHVRWQYYMSEEDLPILPEMLRRRSEQLNLAEPVSTYYDRCNAESTLMREQYVDIKTYLPDNVLAKTDIVSMANSLEVRVPFLDHRIVQFSTEIPAEMKLKAGIQKKHILKRAVKDLLPREIINRPKLGIISPVKSWLRTELSEVSEESLFPIIFKQGFVNKNFVKKLIKMHLNGSRDNSRKLWSLITLEAWIRKNLDVLS